ncbi:hypothetical protein KFK09_016003 [Dendrobium nobile]|uniref:Uncharacterized protein n=1 Tax=Dendrobium nobile TaxID=94219 RepID=A0A8T3BC20_DENNO|nr:hypothetical protein KFK09_016003 [Dendrobium nobile]
MASSAFAIRPYAIFFPFSLSPSKTSNSSSYSVKALNLALFSTPDSDHYGPALRRGQRPTPSDTGCYAPGCDQSSNFDRLSFSRTFNIAALRIPASDCSTLEDRLRGHLLNWPRIRNIARVPGDDIEPDIRNLLRNAEGDGGQRLVSLVQRAGSISDNMTVAMNPVLYREKLAKEFNCRGFLKFRNLARMSRPKKKKKIAEGEGVRVKDRVQKKEYAVVEVTGESEVKEDDMNGLLGADFRSGRWRGSTRLLLLDERLADKALQELPEAVKVNDFSNLLRKIDSTNNPLIESPLIAFSPEEVDRSMKGEENAIFRVTVFIVCDDEEAEGGKNEAGLEEEEELQLDMTEVSLNSVVRFIPNHTMKVKEKLTDRDVVVLIDNGLLTILSPIRSLTNWGVKLVDIGNYGVMMGTRMVETGDPYEGELSSIELGSTDVILGMKWLQIVVDTKVNWGVLTMELVVEGRRMMIKGDVGSVEEHFDHVRVVLEVLQEHQLRANMKKCGFAQACVECLGHVVSQKGYLQTKKDEARQKWPLSRNLSAYYGPSDLHH